MHISKIQQHSPNITKASATTKEVLDALDYYGNNSLSLACTYSGISNDEEKHRVI
jgi:hypothetical protein